jgi:hypothetical protein
MAAGFDGRFDLLADRDWLYQVNQNTGSAAEDRTPRPGLGPFRKSASPTDCSSSPEPNCITVWRVQPVERKLQIELSQRRTGPDPGSS